jgi:AraC-like DNA-binding protein
MSGRTLQRALAAEGASIRDLLNELRRDLAQRYIEESDMALAEVSYLLGFADVSAFHHAFKRWTGCTPVEFRRDRTAADAGLRRGEPRR